MASDAYSVVGPDAKADRVLVDVVSTSRRVKYTPVSDSEMHSLALMNTLATAFYSAAAASLSFAASIVLSESFTKERTPEAIVLGHYGKPACLVLAAFFCVLAVWASQTRSNTFRAMQREVPTNGEEPVFHPTRDGFLWGVALCVVLAVVILMFVID